MNESPYESRILQFEKQFLNKINGKTILIGSSSFELWVTSKYDLLPLQTINLGIGGSKVDDWNYIINRLVTPFKPSNVVVYLGINDILSGINGLDTGNSLIQFYNKIFKQLPNVRLFIVSLNPNVAFKEKYEDIKITNNMIKDYALNNKDTYFIDTYNIFFNTEGNVNPEYYLDDGLHLSNNGYRLWSKVIKQHLLQHIPY